MGDRCEINVSLAVRCWDLWSYQTAFVTIIWRPSVLREVQANVCEPFHLRNRIIGQSSTDLARDASRTVFSPITILVDDLMTCHCIDIQMSRLLSLYDLMSLDKISTNCLARFIWRTFIRSDKPISSYDSGKRLGLSPYGWSGSISLDPLVAEFLW